MPIKVKSDLPVKEILEKENIFVMDEQRALHQDIRPIEIVILNLMPLKEDTELQILRELSNTPLQIHVTFMMAASHEAKNVSRSHLDSFYQTIADLSDRYFDGLIVTGAPVEELPFITSPPQTKLSNPSYQRRSPEGAHRRPSVRISPAARVNLCSTLDPSLVKKLRLRLRKPPPNQAALT